MGLDIEEHDQEGRVITAEYADFYGTFLPYPPALILTWHHTHKLPGCCAVSQAPGRQYNATL